jgi:anti-sigma B factor antagonist
VIRHETKSKQRTLTGRVDVTTTDCDHAAVTQQSPPEPASDDLVFSRRWEDAALIVAVRGEIDLQTVHDLREHLADALDSAGGETCVVDLTGVTFLGSPGLAALLDAAQRARDRNTPLSIVIDANLRVVRPIQITGIDQLLSLFHTVAEALASRKPAPRRSNP